MRNWRTAKKSALVPITVLSRSRLPCETGALPTTSGAIDSIPAVFAVTKDPFIVYSSNIFAILGLRALFFLLANMLDRFVYLKAGVALILVFVGIKMTISGWVHLPILLSLGVIVATLAGSVWLSMRKTAAEAA